MNKVILVKVHRYEAAQYVCPNCDEELSSCDIDLPKVNFTQLKRLEDIEDKDKKLPIEGYYMRCRNCNYRIDYEKPIRIGTEEHNKLPTIVKAVRTETELTDEEKIKVYDNVIKSLM